MPGNVCGSFPTGKYVLSGLAVLPSWSTWLSLTTWWVLPLSYICVPHYLCASVPRLGWQKRRGGQTCLTTLQSGTHVKVEKRPDSHPCQLRPSILVNTMTLPRSLRDPRKMGVKQRARQRYRGIKRGKQLHNTPWPWRYQPTVLGAGGCSEIKKGEGQLQRQPPHAFRGKTEKPRYPPDHPKDHTVTITVTITKLENIHF